MNQPLGGTTSLRGQIPYGTLQTNSGGGVYVQSRRLRVRQRLAEISFFFQRPWNSKHCNQPSHNQAELYPS